MAIIRLAARSNAGSGWLLVFSGFQGFCVAKIFGRPNTPAPAAGAGSSARLNTHSNATGTTMTSPHDSFESSENEGPAQPPETIEVTGATVGCDGGVGPLGHPMVYLTIDKSGRVDCPYCGRRYILRGRDAAGQQTAPGRS